MRGRGECCESWGRPKGVSEGREDRGLCGGRVALKNIFFIFSFLSFLNKKYSKGVKFETRYFKTIAGNFAKNAGF